MADGRVLLHCFGGCATQDVLDAVGLDWSDLMPPRLIADRPGSVRPSFDAWTAIRCCCDDLLLAAVIIGDVSRGIALTSDRRLQLSAIAGRLRAAAEIVGAVR